MVKSVSDGCLGDRGGSRSAVALVAGIVLIMAFIGSGTAVAQDANTSKIFSVSAVDGWQETNIELAAGQQFTVIYISGSWTVDYRNFPQVGPGGYSSDVDSRIYQDCKYDAANQYGALYGQVNATIANGAFAIGKGGPFKAANDGELYLRINDSDRCLVDNAGSITVEITTGAASTDGTAAFFKWLNACVNGDLGAGCQNDAYDIARVSDQPPNLAHCAQLGAEVYKDPKGRAAEAAYTCLGAVAGALKKYWQDHGSN